MVTNFPQSCVLYQLIQNVVQKETQELMVRSVLRLYNCRGLPVKHLADPLMIVWGVSEGDITLCEAGCFFCSCFSLTVLSILDGLE